MSILEWTGQPGTVGGVPENRGSPAAAAPGEVHAKINTYRYVQAKISF